MLYGAVETGGTKIICSVLDEAGQLLDSLRFSTGLPDNAVKTIADYFIGREIAGLGIGSFGPVNLHITSPAYGTVLETPKAGWEHYPFLKRLWERLGVPALMDTDVNCACMGELKYGAARNANTAIYITVGTGIGVGVCIGGETLKGMLHPEAGHILIRRNRQDRFEGICRYHKDCFEGLACGAALEKRCGMAAYELAADAPVWKLEAEYIAQAVTNYILAYSPEKVILGGGVMEQQQLFPMIRKGVCKNLNGYIQTAQMKDLEHYIIPAELNGKQGIMGAYCLAKKAAECGGCEWK